MPRKLPSSFTEPLNTPESKPKKEPKSTKQSSETANGQSNSGKTTAESIGFKKARRKLKLEPVAEHPQNVVTMELQVARRCSAETMQATSDHQLLEEVMQILKDSGVDLRALTEAEDKASPPTSPPAKKIGKLAKIYGHPSKQTDAAVPSSDDRKNPGASDRNDTAMEVEAVIHDLEAGTAADIPVENALGTQAPDAQQAPPLQEHPADHAPRSTLLDALLCGDSSDEDD